jgi:hypothetical protein
MSGLEAATWKLGCPVDGTLGSPPAGVAASQLQRRTPPLKIGGALPAAKRSRQLPGWQRPGHSAPP